MSQEHFKFESETKYGSWTKICDDMMDSEAWQALNRSQRCLYLEMKYKFRANWGGSKSNRKSISDNSRDISFTHADALKIYSDMRTFRTDIDKLIDCGFVDCISSGKITKECNIYGFTERWKKYSDPDYSVPPYVIRPSLTEKEKQARKKAAERNRQRRMTNPQKQTILP